MCFFPQDAIQAQLVIQKMSELTTQEQNLSDDLDPISENSKTLGDQESSSSDNEDTLDEDQEVSNDNDQVKTSCLDTENANLDFSSTTDNENNIPVSEKLFVRFFKKNGCGNL